MKSILKNHSKYSDEVLVVKITKNDVSAFNELYDRYSHRLLNYFFRMLGGDHAKSQDFLQDLFIKVLQKADMFNPTERFITWIYTIAHNMCRNEYRKIQIRSNASSNGKLKSSPEFYDESKKNDIAIDSEIIQKEIYVQVARLKEDHRSTFLLRYQQNLSIKEISDILECSEGTTKSRLYYTTKELSDKLQELNPY